jgi:hypothetical protein
LHDSDYIALRLKPRDTTPTGPANKGFRIWYTVTAQGETPPEKPGGLRKSFYTKRKKDVIEFDFGDSGKTAHFAVQIENDGKRPLGAAGIGFDPYINIREIHT